MIDRRLFLSMAGAAAATPALAETNSSASTPSVESLRTILKDRVETQKQAVGMVIGIVDRAGPRIVTHGRLAVDDPSPVTATTSFEIGSVTKAFTGLLLADLAARGEVRLDDPVNEYLPRGVVAPERGRKITLSDLAMHISGLPRLPTNLSLDPPTDPYSGYTDAQLYAFLSGYQLPRDVGAAYEYSNVGAGLLGLAMARRTGLDFARMVKTRIAGPLRMTDTQVGRSTGSSTSAQGHDAFMTPVPDWTFQALVSTGSLRSTATDVLTLLQAELRLRDTPLREAMDRQLVPRHRIGQLAEVALGWHIRKLPGREVVWHNGGTGGFRSFCGFDRAAGWGAVVLSNTATDAGVDDIAWHLFEGSALKTFQPSPQAIKLDLAAAARWAGDYEAAPGVRMTISVENGRLFAQITNQPKNEIFQSGPNEVFWKAVDVRATVVAGPDDRPSHLVLRQQGRETLWLRVTQPRA